MNAGWRSLRFRLAALGFLAGYLPVLLLFGVVQITDTDVVDTGAGPTVTTHSASGPGWSPVTWTVLALAPAAAGLAWWLAGRAVRPIERIRVVAEQVAGDDPGRRIGPLRGSAEVVSLAASVDAMLDRLEQAADAQRRLVEEASHELRTPLQVLMANADVLLDHPCPTVEVYRQGLVRSKQAALRLRAAIDELLVDGRGQARTIDRTPVDLMVVTREVLADAAVLADRKQISLSVTGPAEAGCRVDASTVRRAIANLVDNAIRYAPVRSEVSVAVELTETEAAVTVTDHGPGIPADQQAQVFNRFWRGRSDQPGTGLGLPIASQIAAAHGGGITIRSPSPAGDGCAFRLTLRR